MRLGLLGVAAVLLGLLSPVRAAVVTWQLQNVGFDDGGQATGWFSVDNVAHTFLDWNISVEGGNTSIFPSVVYDPQTSTILDASYTQPLWDNFRLILYIPEIPRRRDFRLGFDELPDNGGTVGLNLISANGGVECYNCGPARLITGGSISATLLTAVPELSTWAMMLLGFTGIGFVAYRRKSKPALMAT